MGIEGQESPRDVAGEEQKHPWEIFPEDEAAAIEQSQKKRQQDKKRKMKLEKIKLWVKNNKLKVVLLAILTILVFSSAGVGIYFLVNNMAKNSGGNVSTREPEEDHFFYSDSTIETAEDESTAYLVCADGVEKAMTEGYNGNPTILEDNLQNFLKVQKTEYLKDIYEMCGVSKLSLFSQMKYAQTHLDRVDSLDVNSFDSKQLYAYYMSHMIFYRAYGDKKLEKTYSDLLDQKFPQEGGA